MISSIIFVVAAFGVVLPATEAQDCTYWCMNPVTRGYECCDDGNKWYTGEVEVPAEIEGEAVEIETPLEGVDNAGSSGCVYYCLYNGQHYCCDNGENPREYFIPQHHVPQYVGPHGVKTILPQYIYRPTQGYESISATNSFNPLQNRIRGVVADTGDETRHKDVFIGPQGVGPLPPQYIFKPVPGHGGLSDINPFNPFENRIRGVVADTGDETKYKNVFADPQEVGPLPPQYIVRPVPGNGGISDINPFNPFPNSFRGIEYNAGDQTKENNGLIGPQGVGPIPPQYFFRPGPGYGSASDINPFAPFQHSFRGFDADTEEETPDEDAFPLGKYIDHVMNSPTLGRLALNSLMSMMPFEFPEERAETSKSLDESSLTKRQVESIDSVNSSSSSNILLNSLRIPTLDDMSSLFFGNEEDERITAEREIGNAEKRKSNIPTLSAVPLINSFAIPSTSGVNSIFGGVRLIPSKSNLFDKNSISNRIPSNSVFFPIESSLSPVNSTDTKSLSKAVPLISSIKPIPGGIPLGLVDSTLTSPNTSDPNSLSTGVPLPLLSLNNSFLDTNKTLKPNVLSTHSIDLPKGLPDSKDVPLPISQFQANAAFVMQHILQQPEMANAIMHHLQDSIPTDLSTKETQRENTAEAPISVTEESLKNDTVIIYAVTENVLQVNATQEIKKKLPDLSPVPIIESEGNLSDGVIQTPLIPLDLAKDLTSSHLSELSQMKNPQIADIYDKPPANIAPQKLNEYIPIQYQKYPLNGRIPGESGHGSSYFPSKQYPILYNSQKTVYPLPALNQYRRPISPNAPHQTHTTYPKPIYNPSYPKATYNPSSISFSPDFIQTGADTSGHPPTGLMPPSKELKFFSHLPVSISDNLVAPPNDYNSANDSGKIVTDDVLDLVMNINKATCLCLEDGVRKTDASCPCSIEDLVVVFPPNPQQPYLLLPLSKSESFVERFNSDKIEKEIITSPSEYSIQKVSPENQRIKVSKEKSETYPEQEQQHFLEVLKRFHNLSNQIERRTLSDILGNSDKLPKVAIDNDQIEKILDRESFKSKKSIPSRT